MNDKIDVIVPWVDGNDSVWRKEKNEFLKKISIDSKSDSNIRFQSWDNMQYWFRGIENCMPWINNVFFVTWGHVPSFLNLKHPQLRIIKHEDYIPEEYLPTYNSNTIEMNYFRIKELSENFIIFCDDFFPLQYAEEEYYFKDNRVCDEAVENIITTAAFGPVANMSRYHQVNNMFFINKYFSKRKVIEENYEKWYCDDYGELVERTKSLDYWYDFAGFREPHVAASLKKSVLQHLWEIEPEILDKASRNNFRGYSDVTQSLIRFWQLCEGDFCPRKTRGKAVFVDINNYKDIAQDIKSKKWDMVSINENCTPEEFEIIKQEINGALEYIFPNKSSFEI